MERVKAVVIDGMMMVIMMFLFYKLFSFFGEVPDWARGAVIIFVFVIYDPITVSLFGATMGHSSVGIKVKRLNDHSKSIPFHFAFLRFATKLALGWISLISVSFDEQKRAMHDMVAGSIVLYQTEPEVGENQE